MDELKRTNVRTPDPYSGFTEYCERRNTKIRTSSVTTTVVKVCTTYVLVYFWVCPLTRPTTIDGQWSPDVGTPSERVVHTTSDKMEQDT